MISRFLASQFSGYIAIAAVAVIIGGVWYIRHTGYKACQNDQAAKEVTIVGKRNEIANNRPDTAILVKRLRDGKF